MAEHPAVNRRVVGSSPTCGVNNSKEIREAFGLPVFTFPVIFPVSHVLARERRDKIDLILMGLTMPVLDGYEATRQILTRPETHDIPVVAVSAHCDAEHNGAALEAGCLACVGEPVDFGLLTQLVGRYARGV